MAVTSSQFAFKSLNAFWTSTDPDALFFKIIHIKMYSSPPNSLPQTGQDIFLHLLSPYLYQAFEVVSLLHLTTANNCGQNVFRQKSRFYLQCVFPLNSHHISLQTFHRLCTKSTPGCQCSSPVFMDRIFNLLPYWSHTTNRAVPSTLSVTLAVTPQKSLWYVFKLKLLSFSSCFTKFWILLGYLLNIDIRYHCQERLPTNVFHIEAAWQQIYQYHHHERRKTGHAFHLLHFFLNMVK